MSQKNPSSQFGPDDEAIEEALAPQSGADIPPHERAKDPVCGSIVDKRTAQFTTNYAGDGGKVRTYYFQSDECKQLFERDPEKYVHQA